VALTRFLVGASLNIYFVAVLHRGVFGLIFSELISAVLFSPVYLWHLVPDLGLTFSRPILGRLLAFGLPGVPSSLASMAMSYVDRFFLQHYCSTKEVGLYSLGYSIGLVINLAVQAVQLAWPAHMFVIARRPDAEKQLSKMLTYYVAGMGFAGLSVSVLTPEILTIMTTPQFYPAGTVVPFITVSYVLYGTRFMVNSGLEIHNKLYYSALIIVGSALMNLLLNFLLIPPYGMLGAAVATLLSYGVLLLAQASVNLRFWHIPYQYGRLIKVALTWGAIFGASLLIHASSPWLNGALKLLLLATYPLLLYGLSFFEASELAKIRQLLRIGSNPNP
jgi:O-antigen/teichoic acid export membrane protein